ncbi:tripartite tricarboxylate transporter permease [Brevibacterium sp. UCMA 11754]|uniref:tripartite tricarboxylate transporter permease n=1 Tax=Brevibacterium sp. UCMA 11754 TaxID=2749198 RepID=UPI00228679B2|nr:tripartite tricarboxylate transporter permease [Brevibacterium sp. UCMA 11754]
MPSCPSRRRSHSGHIPRLRRGEAGEQVQASHREGCPEAVASPEAANNAAANASFIPTLALGIPGSGTTAVLLGAFVIFGLQPGPLLFQQEPDLVWGLLVSFFFGNLILLVLNLPLAPVFAQILRIPYVFLYPIVLMMSFVGAFALGNNTFTLWIVFFAGLLGYFMKRFDFPAAPFVLGLVLGPLLEKYLVQTSAMGDGNLFIMFQRPFSLILTVAALIALAYPLVTAVIRNLRTRKAGAKAKENVAS